MTALHSGVNSLAFFCCAILTCPLLPAEELTQIPKFGIVLVLVVVLVLGALGFPDRRETDVMQLICSVSLIAKRDSRGRGRLLKFENLELTGEGPRRYFSHNLNQTLHRCWFTRARSVQGYRN